MLDTEAVTTMRNFTTHVSWLLNDLAGNRNKATGKFFVGLTDLVHRFWVNVGQKVAGRVLNYPEARRQIIWYKNVV